MKPVDAPQSKRVVGGHDGEINLARCRKVDNSVQVLRADFRDTYGVFRNAAVARKRVNDLYRRIFFQFLDNGVLTASAAYYQQFHDSILRAQWWKRRIPVKDMTMLYLSAVSMTLSSRMEPPGCTI